MPGPAKAEKKQKTATERKKSGEWSIHSENKENEEAEEPDKYDQFLKKVEAIAERKKIENDARKAKREALREKLREEKEALLKAAEEESSEGEEVPEKETTEVNTEEARKKIKPKPTFTKPVS